MSFEFGGYCAGGGLTKPLHNSPFRTDQPIGDHRIRKPVPPLSEYQAYEQTLGTAARKSFNPRLVRRLAIVIREGNAVQAACKMIGLHPHYGTSSAYRNMPEHLK